MGVPVLVFHVAMKSILAICMIMKFDSIAVQRMASRNKKDGR